MVFRPAPGEVASIVMAADSVAPEVMTVEDVAAYLRIPKSSVYKLAQLGRIPSQKVGRHWRFRREALDRWLEAGNRQTLSR